MDNSGPPNSGGFRVDPYKAVQTPWNMMPQYQLKEMNAFVMHIYAEKHAALEELDRVINEKNTATEERNKAIKERDEAVAARDIAIRERNNVIAALQFQEKSSTNGNLEKRGLKRENLENNSSSSKSPKIGKKLSEDLNIYVSTEEDESRDIDMYMGNPVRGLRGSDVHKLPSTSREDIDLYMGNPVRGLRESDVQRQRQRQRLPSVSRESVSREDIDLYMGNPVRDLRDTDVHKLHSVSREAASREGIDLYTENPGRGLGGSDIRNLPPVSNEDIDLINQINLEGGGVPPPVCSCTGILRQCYKSGNGGWQSSCCTLTIAVYPLPQLPNKRHSRMGGRKMSGNVFGRLINRLAEEGHDLSVPVDLKNYWAKHGPNRYVTVK